MKIIRNNTHLKILDKKKTQIESYFFEIDLAYLDARS